MNVNLRLFAISEMKNIHDFWNDEWLDEFAVWRENY